MIINNLKLNFSLKLQFIPNDVNQWRTDEWQLAPRPHFKIDRVGDTAWSAMSIIRVNNYLCFISAKWIKNYLFNLTS